MTEPIKALDVHDRSRILEGEMVISSSLRNRRQRRATPPPPCAKVVGGPITPNVKGCYCFAGYYGNRLYYKHRELDWYIWYYPLAEPLNWFWILSSVLGSTPGPYWSKQTALYEIELGDYAPHGGATGTAKVENPPS